MVLPEPFAETLQSFGQCRLVGRRFVAIIFSARLGHACSAFDTPATLPTDRGRSAAP
jgi:hypothetical protein